MTNTIDANGESLMPRHAREALAYMILRCVEPSKVETSHEQSVEWENSAIVVQYINSSKSLFSQMPERTLAGYKLIVSPDIPRDVIRFCDEDGRVLCEITNLKVPS